jgi:vacuolar-type H+-ATPase subunit H
VAGDDEDDAEADNEAGVARPDGRQPEEDFAAPSDASTIDPDVIARALRDASSTAPDVIARALRDASSTAPDVIARALRDASTTAPDVIARALRDASTIDPDAIARALEASRQNLAGAPEKLVPEAELDEPPEEEQEPSLPREEVARELIELRESLHGQGISSTVHGSRLFDGGYELRFDLIAGRSTRTVAVDVASARVLLSIDVSAWRSLQRYDGIWSEPEGVVEIALRGERFGPSPSHLLRRLSANSSSRADVDPEASGIELTDEATRIMLRIGPASEVAHALLSLPNRPRRRFLTVRLSNVAVSTADTADELAERVADALSLDLDLTLGVSLMPQRLENRDLARRRSVRRGGPFTFPRNSYPHAPILLYQAGRDRATAPLIRYWSLYQVLEYFFPKHSQAQALRQLARHLRSPSFNAHHDEDVLRAVQLATAAGKGSGSEEDQLVTTLRAITTPVEILNFAEEGGITDHLEDRRSELTNRNLKLSTGDELLVQLGQRIYDIRCRIVHSKGGSQRDGGPGLLPGTHHDDLIRIELPLMEYLAQQALVSAAEPLSLPHRAIPT